MKKKELIIGISIFSVALILTISGALYVKNKSKLATNNKSEVEYFQVEEASGLKFKGSSIISNEQKIFLDATKGELNEVFVEDGQEVEKDVVLFNYYNEIVQDQIDELDRQINSLSSKIEREKANQAKLEALKKEAEAQAAAVAAAASNNENTQVPSIAENNQVQQIDNAGVIEELQATLNDTVAKRDSLKEDVVTEVKSEISGKVYITKDDPTKEYMRVISTESLISAEATEFDINEIKLDSKVDIKVISNNEKLTGTVTKIEDIPTMSVDQKSAAYKFYVKPDKSVKIGFSVEVAVNSSGIVIPKSSVIEEEGKLYVMLSEGESNNKVEIKATLKDDNYIIEDDNLKVGDKIMLNPSEDSKEEV